VARADGHAWRARACAILTGIGTIRHDDPQLSVREVPTPRQPLKVIVDRHGETPAGARALADGAALIFTAVTPRESWPSRVQSQLLPDRDGRVDLVAMLAALGARGINEVHVEAGAKLNGALLAAGLVDELLLYLAPCLLGEPARGMFDLPSELDSLAKRVQLRVVGIDQLGGDWRIVARVPPRDG
jgi:diaminohydroxyphosphoribosylaminopyrimidine deaminase/5-amino-6-(5-phosphoribosylamino)uracil reductase